MSGSNVESRIMKRANEIGAKLGLCENAIRDLMVDLSQMHNDGYHQGLKEGHKKGWADAERDSKIVAGVMKGVEQLKER